MASAPVGKRADMGDIVLLTVIPAYHDDFEFIAYDFTAK